MRAPIERLPAWMIPLLAAVILAAPSYWAFQRLERTIIRDIEASLVALRDSASIAIEIWAREKRSSVALLARDRELQTAIRELLRLERELPDPLEALERSPAQAAVRRMLDASVPQLRAVGYGVVTPGGYFVAQMDENGYLVGRHQPDVIEPLGAILSGRADVTSPIDDDTTGMTIIVGSPIQATDGRVIGAFGFRLDPIQELGTLLRAIQAGETGSAYVLDREGRLLSETRFSEELAELGLIEPGESPALKVQIRDPGGDLREGHVPDRTLAARPFTDAAAAAIAGESGVHSRAYRDFRGVEVVGAWTWLPDLDIGLIVEIEAEEAFDSLTAVRDTFRIVLALLALSAAGLFGYSVVARRLRSQVDRARQLGRYEIESLIGKGGMGTVYLARHALLRRPTAIKVLNTDRAGKEGLARFEREVQTTSQLCHPNTVEIYDYGSTADGTFYYAMEYLQGETLAEIVRHDGPFSEARTLSILQQVSGSLAEAHEAGLIHRDIKPSNIMLCIRGGVYDFAKVLDFGLVRSAKQTQDAALTDVSTLTGTPLYMSPEAIRDAGSIDVRSDVYQLGLIAYYLLTGRPPFTAESPMDVMLKHASEPPRPPSETLGRPVSPDLEKLVLDCLSKQPDERPENAGALLRRLEQCPVEGSWSQTDAIAWWSHWLERAAARRLEADTQSRGSMPSGIEPASRAPVS